MLNPLDRLIAYVAPQRAINRAAARMALGAFGGGYDGAAVGRRTGGWFATNAAANALIRGPLPQLRARSRDIMRNTWWGARIKNTVTNHAVGYGVTIVFKTGDKALDKKASDLFAGWVCDVEEQLDFNGQLALLNDCAVEAGESLLRFIPVPYVKGEVPLKLQLLEPDHLDASHDGIVPGSASETLDTVRVIDQGIEYDRYGRRLAFWLYPEHPGSTLFRGTGLSTRVPAADVVHLYRKDRIGQGRGVPWIAPVILKGRDVADLEEAVVVKARIEACLAAFIKTANSNTTLAAKTHTEAHTQRRIEHLSPGMIIYGAPGEEASTIAPSSSLSFESVLVSSWFTLAAGAGITYDQLTGDFRQSNFSSMRAGKTEFKRGIERYQFLTLKPMAIDRIVGRFLSAAQDAGLLPRRSFPRELIFPAWEPIDPLKEMQADYMAVRSGRMTWRQFCAAWGVDPDRQLDEIAAWLDQLDTMRGGKGIALDVDPRRIFKGAGKLADPAVNS